MARKSTVSKETRKHVTTACIPCRETKVKVIIPAPTRTGRKQIIDFDSAMEQNQAVAIATEEGESVIIDSETIDGSMYHAGHMQMSL